MKIYCMSDIHGCLSEFEVALSLFVECLDRPDTKLILLGDYIHRGEDSYGVLDKIMHLQKKYGSDKVIALLGNHEVFVLTGEASIEHMIIPLQEHFIKKKSDNKYIQWLKQLPKYHIEGNTIFVHAGIDEFAGEFWEWETLEDLFVNKYPAEIGRIEGLDKKVVAGHIATSIIAENPEFHDVYYDGESHYYIDGTVCESGEVLVLMVDTETDKYYRVTESGNWLILPYEEEIEYLTMV